MNDAFLDLLEGDISSMSKEDLFNNRTYYHIELVRKYLNKIIALNDPRLDRSILLKEMDHDASKFKEPEYTPYLNVNWKHHLKDRGKEFIPTPKEKEDMDIATLHHVTTNKHHPEYWSPNPTINKEDRDKPPSTMVDATRMPLSYIASMCADWKSMAYEKSTSLKDWADKNVNIRWKFSNSQVKLIYDLIDYLGDMDEDSLMDRL